MAELEEARLAWGVWADSIRRVAEQRLGAPRSTRRVAALGQAAAALAIARQTVLHKVQRGELAAVHVNKGQRQGLRIQVNTATLDYSTHPDERKAQC